jgi:putative ABC transport system permease protein
LIGFLFKLTRGHYRRHRLEGLLCLLGVALGVAVVVSIDAAVNACVQSFGGAVQSLAERSTHSIFAEGGTIPDRTYIQLLKKDLPFPLAPVIDRGVLIAPDSPVGAHGRVPPPTVPQNFTSDNPAPPPAESGLFARLIGVDVFSERSLRSYTKMQSSLDEAAFQKFLTQPNQVVLVDDLARRLNATAGSNLQLTAGDKRIRVHVIGVVQPTGVARTQLTDLIICDLATAQELTGAIGRIDRIDTILKSPAEEAAITAALPPGLVLRSTRQQASSLTDLTRSYRLNLNALSLMASFVAVFIVYNSMLISVQQRATSLGILRCLGGSRMQLGGVYLLEAVLFAFIGGVVGVLGGWLLSRVLVGSIATTINDLYAAVRPAPVGLTSAMWFRGLTVSAASCLAGALIPLLQASHMPPVNAFRSSARHRASGAAANWLLLAGVLLLLGSWGVWMLPGNSPVAGFVMALLIALGFAFTCPWMTRAASGLINRVSRPLQLLPLQMAASGVSRSLGITGVAVAATMLALAMNVGVRTMVSSFRGSLNHWMDQRFAADVFIGPELTVNHKIDATLDPRVVQWVRTQPQVTRMIENRVRNIDATGIPIVLVGTDVAQILATLPMKVALSNTQYDPTADALISEPLAGRERLRPGDSLELQTPAGIRRFRVYGILYDFGSERGQVTLDRRTYAADWQDDAISSLHVTLAPGNDRVQTAARWGEILRADYPVVVNSFDGVKREVMTVFDRTFKVTRVLGWLAGGVAFCGLAGSLLALALARRRDYSILAAVGMSARQTAAWVLGQGILIAWAAALIACAAGTILAYVLAYVIQYRSFGWSIPTAPEPYFWFESFVLATVAALIATVYPVYRLRAAAPAGNLRQE